MKKYYIPFLLVSCMLFFGCNKNSTATETETTQSTPSKKFKENVNKSCTYIAYRDKVIVLDNKNNIAKLTNLNDVESTSLEGETIEATMTASGRSKAICD